VNLLLEVNHYSVNGKKHCSFSEGQDINQEYSDVLGINDVILNPERIRVVYTPFCRNATTRELNEGRKDRNLILEVVIFYGFRS
jgi:hypothetical protein